MATKSLTRMKKIELLELLAELTRENETLKMEKNALEEAAQAQAQTAAAEQALQAEKQAALQAELDQAGEQIKGLEKELAALNEREKEMPVGSFAEAMVRNQEIVQSTQRAADEYLAACQRKLDDANAQAWVILAGARAEAEEIVRQAEDHKRATEEKEEGIRKRLKEEMAGLNELVETMTQRKEEA